MCLDGSGQFPAWYARKGWWWARLQVGIHALDVCHRGGVKLHRPSQRQHLEVVLPDREARVQGFGERSAGTRDEEEAEERAREHCGRMMLSCDTG